jgi:hypothetical protein
MIEAWILEGMMAFRKGFGFALVCLGFLQLGWSFGVLGLSLPFGSASAGLLKEIYFGCLIGLLCKRCFEALLLLKQAAVFWCIIGPQPAWLNCDEWTLPTLRSFWCLIRLLTACFISS